MNAARVSASVAVNFFPNQRDAIGSRRDFYPNVGKIMQLYSDVRSLRPIRHVNLQYRKRRTSTLRQTWSAFTLFGFYVAAPVRLYVISRTRSRCGFTYRRRLFAGFNGSVGRFRRTLRTDGADYILDVRLRLRLCRSI
jgi:hypothetical protein